MKHVLTAIALAALAATLMPAAAICQEPTIETGEIDGAPYRIQIPSGWNNCLVIYAHAYRPEGAAWLPIPDPLGSVFLERGFALAESGYARQGWAVEEGVTDTEALRLHFIERHGEPDSTFITGHSLGGMITLATIEQYPESYNGALPMCGLLSPAVAYFKDRTLDMLVTFEFFFGGSLAAHYRPVAEAPALPPQVIGDALAADSAAAAEYSRHWGIRTPDLPGLLSFHHMIFQELKRRIGGNPADNRGTIYCWADRTNELNAGVHRTAADPAALEYLRHHYTPAGIINDPVIAVHTTYDPGVPPYLANAYQTLLSLHGCERWFVQYRVVADGHCNIAPELMAKAFDQLRAWAATGVRPESGVLR